LFHVRGFRWSRRPAEPRFGTIHAEAMTFDLETKRLRLRRWRRDDVGTLARWNADPMIMTHMGRPPMSHAETEAQLDRLIRHWDEHGFGTWAAEEKATGKVVGRIGLSFHSEWPDDPEVGWMLDAAHWNRGLATEGGEACIRFGFERLGVARIVSICTPENAASRRVMEKLGLRYLTEKTHLESGILLWIHAIDRSP
jgi:RimJ/RimL family protein N-acetyltransferase